jgi:hypothetical protein
MAKNGLEQRIDEGAKKLEESAEQAAERFE